MSVKEGPEPGSSIERIKNILVLDDDEALRKFAIVVLTEAGYRVHAVGNGNQAEVICHRETIDLLITDLVMPDREGMEVIRTFRKQFPSLRIIAMSGVFGPEILNTSLYLGAEKTLIKPFVEDELLQAVKEVIGGPISRIQ